MRLNRPIFSSLFLVLSLLTQAPAWAVEFGISRPAALGSEHQSYFERPDILQIEAREHPELQWQSWQQAHLEAAAAFLELYPTEPLYFLARDAELLYDAVRVISRDDPQTLARLHLLNVSNKNMWHENLLDYLAQEGISAQRLRSDPSFRPILIDTGFNGTISRVIAARLPGDVRQKIKTHLLVSMNQAMPSLRSFLHLIDPDLGGLTPSSMADLIEDEYEHIPRSTDRSQAYRQIEGQWHPVSDLDESTGDGTVTPLVASHYQENLKAYLETPEAQTLLQERRAVWRNLRQNWLNLSQGQWIEFLKARHEDEPLLRDFLEWVSRIGRHTFANAPIVTINQIGLDPEIYPFGEEEQEEIQAVLDEIVDHLDRPEVYADVQNRLSRIADRGYADWAWRFFAHPSSHSYPELLRLAIEAATPQQMKYFAAKVFSERHWAFHPELLRLAVEKAPAGSLSTFFSTVFNRSYWTVHPEIESIRSAALESGICEQQMLVGSDD